LIEDATDTAKLQASLEEMQDINEMLRSVNMLDGLTGVLNRFQIEREMGREFERAKRYGTKFTVGMLDLDHFKLINDQHGHLAGDDVLRVVASGVTGQLRAVDFVGRFGGEEFVFLLAETDEAGAEVVAERLRGHIQGLTINHRELSITVTASIGVVAFHPQMNDVRHMMYLADTALYRAKEQGRNRVVIYRREADGELPPRA
jgi:diguanylate cyclase (GGDEF)-like protein